MASMYNHIEQLKSYVYYRNRTCT